MKSCNPAPIAFFLLAACTTAPTVPIPLPLPETLSWASGAESTTGGAFLGLKTRENVSGSFDDLDFPPGVRVTRVVEHSPAAEAGVRPGDVLLRVGSNATDDPGTLAALLLAATPGDEWTLDVQRGDTVFGVPVRLDGPAGEPGDAAGSAAVEPLYRLDPARSRAGWLTGQGGVVLVSAAEASPFPRAGIPVGSVVLAVDGEEVLSDQGLIRRLLSFEPGTRVDVKVQGEPHEIRVTLQEQPTRITEFSFPVLGGYWATAEGNESSFVLIDLWLISLFRYERQGEEQHWSFLRFIDFATGVGELTH